MKKESSLEEKIKILQEEIEQKNEIIKTLEKSISVSFPQFKSKNTELNSSSSTNIIYFVLDIRNSSDINEFIVQKRGVTRLAEFYDSFKDLCNKVAVDKYQAWFRRQIGDRMDFAWTSNDINKALFTAIEINDEVQLLRRQFEIPMTLDIGIGLCVGDVKIDTQLGELKGEAPRIANELQEKNTGIFFKFDLENDSLNLFSQQGWKQIKRKINVRGKITEVNELRKLNKEKYNIKKEDTFEILKATNRIFSDNHIHIEGASINNIEFKSMFEQSAKLIRKNDFLRRQVKSVTNQEIEEIVDNFVNVDNDDEESITFSFREFLNRMYSTKIILSTNYTTITKFVESVLNRYFNKFFSVRLGITPSLPIDFPYLNANRWNQSIYKGIKNALDNNPGKNLTLVVETKRQHLDSIHNTKPVYEYNIDFLKYIYDKGDNNISFSISICDDASIYPLFNKEREEGLKKYLNYLSEFPDITLSLHILETLPFLENVDKDLQKLVQTNPLYELERVIEILDDQKIYNVNFIHMGNIFAGAKTDTTERTEEDNQKIKNGKKLLQKIIKRNDKIIVCYSSNKYLKNPHILEYPEIISLLIKGRINISIGSDDPGPFSIKDVTVDLQKIREMIKSKFSNGIKIDGVTIGVDELSKIVPFILARNSWINDNSNFANWNKEMIKTITNSFNLDEKTFAEIMCLDIYQDNSQLENPEIRRAIIDRESQIEKMMNI